MLRFAFTYLGKDRVSRPTLCQSYHGLARSFHIKAQLERHGYGLQDESEVTIIRLGSLGDEIASYKT